MTIGSIHRNNGERSEKIKMEKEHMDFLKIIGRINKDYLGPMKNKEKEDE